MKNIIKNLVLSFLCIKSFIYANSNTFTVLSDVNVAYFYEIRSCEPVPIGFRYSLPEGKELEGVFEKPIPDVGNSISISGYLLYKGRYFGPCATFHITVNEDQSVSITQDGNRCYDMSCAITIPSGGSLSGHTFSTPAGENFNENYTITLILNEPQN